MSPNDTIALWIVTALLCGRLAIHNETAGRVIAFLVASLCVGRLMAHLGLAGTP